MKLTFILVVLLCATHALAHEAKPIPRSRPLLGEIELVKAGKPTAAIAAAQEYSQAAQRLQSAVRNATGAVLPIISDQQAASELGKQNLVVIGNLDTNRVSARLYRNYYVTSDALVPGAGQYELRTVHDPEALGIGVVSCGGSDRAGIEASVQRLLAHIQTGQNLSLRHLVETEVDGLPAPLAGESLNAELEKLKGHSAAASFIIKHGGRYYRSGNAAHLNACKGAVPRLLADLNGTDVLESLYGVAWLGPVWDQIEEADLFSDEDRAIVCGYLAGCLELATALHQLAAPEDRPIHYSHAHLGGHLASLYLHRFCPGIDRADDVHRRLTRHYQMQSRFWKPANESSWYTHQYVKEIVIWCMTMGDLRYMERGNLARFCDYIMSSIISNTPSGTGFGDGGGGPGKCANILHVGAWYYRDGRYEWFKNYLAGGWDPKWNFGHTFASKIKAKMPDDILGIHVVPVEDWTYAAGADQPGAPPRERAYDKISFRSAIDKDAQYLLLDGLSGFNHGHADANQIVNFHDKGSTMMTSGGYMVFQLSEHNVVAVNRNGEGGIETVPVLADLELVADLPEFGCVRSTLHQYNGTDWSRNILWAKDRYFLVIDELMAVKKGDYLLQAWWKPSGAGPLEGRQMRGGGKIGLQWTNLDQSVLTEKDSLHNQRQLLGTYTTTMDPGESRYFTNLLQVTAEPHDQAVQPRLLAGNAVTLRRPDGKIEVLGIRPLSHGNQIEVEAQLYMLQADHFSLVQGRNLICGNRLFSSDKDVTVDCDLARGHALLVLHDTTSISLAAESLERIQVNGQPFEDASFADGMLNLTLPAGRHELVISAAADHVVTAGEQTLNGAWNGSRIPPVTPPGLKSEAPQLTQLWQWKTESQAGAKPRALAIADLDSDGRNEVLVGGEDKFLRAFDDEGRLMWKFQADQWVTSLSARDLEGDGTVEVLVGTGMYPVPKNSNPDIYILNGQGDQMTRIPSPITPASTDRNKWGTSPGAIEVIDALDVDGDQTLEIIAGSTNMTLFCLRRDGTQLWNAFNYAHRPNNLQFHDVNGDDVLEIVCTTSFHETNFFDLAGKHNYRIKSGGPGLAVGDFDGDGTVDLVTGSQHGPVSLTRYDSSLVEFRDWIQSRPGIWTAPVAWSFDTGGSINVVEVAALRPEGPKQIIACSQNGIVYAFQTDGTIRWARSLADVVRALAVADLNGNGIPEIIAGNDSGQIFVLDGDGRISAQAQAPGLVHLIKTADLNGDGTAEVVAATDGPGLCVLQWAKQEQE